MLLTNPKAGVASVEVHMKSVARRGHVCRALGRFLTMTGKKEEIDVERHSFGGLVLYEVTSDEIEQIERETLSVAEDLTFAVLGLSVGISFLIALMTVDNLPIKTFTVFLVLCVVGFVVAVYCGVHWFTGKRSFRRVISRVKARVGPLGQQGKELGPNSIPSAPQEATAGGDQ